MGESVRLHGDCVPLFEQLASTADVHDDEDGDERRDEYGDDWSSNPSFR
jgi:hypothetical protein